MPEIPTATDSSKFVTTLLLADNFKAQGKYDEALKGYLEYLQNNSDNKKKGQIYLRIGEIFREMNMPDSAENNLNSAEIIFSALSDSTELSKVYNNKANLYWMAQKYDYALTYYQKSLDLKRRTNNEQLTASTLNNIGSIFLQMKNYNKAEKYLRESIAVKEKFNDIDGVAASYSNLAGIKYKLQAYNEAVSLYKKALRYSYLSSAYKTRATVLMNLSRSYEKLGQTPTALRFFKHHIALQDSIFSEKKYEEFAELKEKYESEKKDQQILLQNIELEKNRTQRYFLISAVLFLVVIGLLVLWRYYEKRKDNFILKAQKSKISEINKSLEEANRIKDQLFSIIAHDLRSPIASLNNASELMEYYITSNEEIKLKSLLPSIRKSFQQVNALIENLLNWALSQRGKLPFQPVEINLNELLEASVENCQHIAKMKNISLSFSDTDKPQFINADMNMIQSVMNNLINNAIKFTNKNGLIEIRLSPMENLVKVEVKDNGIGLTQLQIETILGSDFAVSQHGTENEKGSGLGLKICKEFLGINNGKLYIESKINEGSIFGFILPVVNIG